MSTPANMLASVLVCSHNPRPAHLTRVLQALRAQTLPVEQWEMLLVDNACVEPLAQRFDLSWHPRGEHVREDQIGKTNAFLRGLAHSAGSVLVIVDDDNVLAPDYLQQALAIAAAHSDLGAWGGNVRLVFDEPPPDWTRRYWTFLAQQNVAADSMVCNLAFSQPLPVGAGCCVRRQVAERYATLVADSPWRRALGPTGRALLRCEDTDLVLTACEMGMSRGLFKSLHLDHLIPPERVREEYLLRLYEGIQFSSRMLEVCRDPRKAPPPVCWWWWVKFYADCATKFGRKRRFYLAYKRAQRRAREAFEAMQG